MHALAEETMIEAWRLLLRMPDREKGWLKQGTQSWWPEIVRDIQADYADAEATPRTSLGRREVARVERAFVVPLCLAEAVPAPHRRLFMMVIAAKAGRMPGGFQWSDIWERMGARKCGTTSDGLRARYEAALRCVAIRIATWAIASGEADDGACVDNLPMIAG